MLVAFCVCVPARDEAAHITTLIEALARQSVHPPIRIALCVNNSADGTAELARTATRSASDRIDLTVVECHFESTLAHAGSARRAAMDLGAQLLEQDEGILISTDADCRPPEDWIEANLRACAADTIVGGRIELDDREAIDPAIRSFRARFDRYWQEVRTIEDAIDPIAWDPSPRHGDHTGASLALTVDLYRRSGGVPLISTGEDRALVDAAVIAGGRLVHPAAVWTRASARTAGRATGGMALDMADWIARYRAGDVPRVPSLDHWRNRAAWRRSVRERDGVAAMLAEEQSLPPMACDMNLLGIDL